MVNSFSKMPFNVTGIIHCCFSPSDEILNPQLKSVNVVHVKPLFTHATVPKSLEPPHDKTTK